MAVHAPDPPVNIHGGLSAQNTFSLYAICYSALFQPKKPAPFDCWAEDTAHFAQLSSCSMQEDLRLCVPREPGEIKALLSSRLVPNHRGHAVDWLILATDPPFSPRERAKAIANVFGPSSPLPSAPHFALTNTEGLGSSPLVIRRALAADAAQRCHYIGLQYDTFGAQK